MLRAVTLSRKGEKSDRNEDACIALPGLGVFAVADGVGGNPDGEQASRQIVETLYAELHDADVTQVLIEAAIASANLSVYELSGDVDAGKRMASTLVLAWKTSSKLFCFGVGDSRIYRFRDGQGLQLTKDHVKTVRVANGSKNMVTRAIGLNSNVVPDVTEWDWRNNDMLLLASDGISDRLSEEMITNIMTHRNLSMSDKAKTLVDESERRGGRDDKTVVLVF
ncbi:MAG: protein phosphatase 2C domain-containing protein [Pseudomonadales bacterium]|nr:protein phosphatase 2C domain-containing protein [Pseudomonadales bacterium]